MEITIYDELYGVSAADLSALDFISSASTFCGPLEIFLKVFVTQLQKNLGVRTLRF